MVYELKLPIYSGPLEKLLELIEDKKLEINELSLAQVTDDFLRYIQEIKNGDKADPGQRLVYLRTIADFIVIASRLIFIKSRSLLPETGGLGEEEAEIKDLEFRLKLYREFKPAMKNIAFLWGKGDAVFSRPYFLNAASFLGPRNAVFYPGNNLNIGELGSALQKLLDILRKFEKDREVMENSAISLDERVGQIVSELKKLNETSLKMLANPESRSELIVTFLALLHLAREQIITLTQEDDFSDIMVKKSQP